MSRGKSEINAARGARIASAAAVGLIGIAAGCGLRSPRYNPSFSAGFGYQGGVNYGGAAGPTYGSAVQPPSSGAVTGGGPQAMLAAVDQVLRQQGYQPLGQPVRQALPERGLVGYPIVAQPGMCYTIIALGGAGVGDVDMEVYSPTNREVGEDRAPDAHPNVSFCASEFGMHVARVSMFRGAGDVYFAVYQGPPGSSGVNLASVWGGGGGAPQAPTSIDPSTAARVQSITAQLQSRGYTPTQQPVAVVMRQGSEQSWQINLGAGACYSFATFGGPGVRDSDVFLFDGSGSQRIAGDAGTAVDAVIHDICPDVTGTYQLRARLYSGNGPVWVTAFMRPNQASGGSANTQTQVMINTQSGSAAGIDAFFSRVDRDLQGRGYLAVGAPVTGTLGSGAMRDVPVNLEAGACYAITAVGDSTVQDVDLFLLDSSNNEIDRDHAADARPVVRVCPSASGRFTMRVRMVAGEGQYRAALYRWTGGTSGAGMSGLLFVRNAEVSRIVNAEGYQGDADFSIERGRISENQSRTHNVTLRNGVCYAFVAVGGVGVSDLDLTVSRGNRTVAEDTTPTAFPSARYCATENGMHRVTVRSEHGSGEYVFRVFRRQSNGTNP